MSQPDPRHKGLLYKIHFRKVNNSTKYSHPPQTLILSRKPRETAIVIYRARPAVTITDEPEIVMTFEITANFFSS